MLMKIENWIPDFEREVFNISPIQMLGDTTQLRSIKFAYSVISYREWDSIAMEESRAFAMSESSGFETYANLHMQLKVWKQQFGNYRNPYMV